MKKNLKFRQSLSPLQSWIWIKTSVAIKVQGRSHVLISGDKFHMSEGS